MPASDSNSTHSVGSHLRESRESQGITLDEAARVTRIGKNYLAAIEDETFDSLPSTAYVKGFLRAYAAFLGLSGDEIVAMYERSVSPAAPYPSTEKAGSRDSHVGDMKLPRRRHWAVPLVLLVLVIAVAYLFDDRETRPRKASPPIELSPVVGLTAPIQPVRSSAQGQAKDAKLPADTGMGEQRAADADSQGSGIVLKLKVNQDSWLNITIDDTVSQQYDLKAGDLIEWKGDRVFALDIGNAGGIEAEFNGKPLKAFGESGKPAHAVLKADGTSP